MTINLKKILATSIATIVLAGALGASASASTSPYSASYAGSYYDTTQANYYLKQEEQRLIQQGSVTPQGIKGFLVKLAAQTVAWAIKNGGKILGQILGKMDSAAGNALKNNATKIGNKIESIAEIPGITTNIIKDKLYTFLKMT